MITIDQLIDKLEAAKELGNEGGDTMIHFLDVDGACSFRLPEVTLFRADSVNDEHVELRLK